MCEIRWSEFEVFVTADKNMYYQQNFTGLQVSVIVIPANRKQLVEKCVLAFLQSLERIKPGQQVVIDMGSDSNIWRDMELHAVDEEENHISHVFKLPGM